MYRSKTLFRAFIVALLLAGPHGCVDEPPPPDSGQPPDATPDAAPLDLQSDTPPTEKVTFTVEDYSLAQSKGTPLKDAWVAVDQQGTRLGEAQTDASGHATFDVDFSKGAVDVIAAKAGYSIDSASGLASKNDVRTLRLETKSTAQPSKTTISGSAKGWDGKALLEVRASRGLSTAQVFTKGKYSLEVEAGKPCTLVGVLYQPATYDPKTRTRTAPTKAWATAEWDGKGRPTTIDLDFTNPTTPTTFKGSMAAPASAFGGEVQVFDWQLFRSGYASFEVSKMTERVLGSGGVSYEGEYVTAKAVSAPVTYYKTNVNVGTVKSTTYVYKDGYPQDGATITGFIAAPTQLKPMPSDIPVKLTTKLEWTSSDKLEYVALEIYDKQGQFVWWATTTGGTSSLTLPELPKQVNQATLLGTEVLSGKILFCGETDKKLDVCGRGVRISKWFRLDPKP